MNERLKGSGRGGKGALTDIIVNPTHVPQPADVTPCGRVESVEPLPSNVKGESRVKVVYNSGRRPPKL